MLVIASLLAGLVFGLGLILSGMVNPAKVLGFLDLGGPWDPSLALVMAVDSPGLRLNLDLYHAQIGEGNLIDLLGRCLPWIGEIQVADVPGRCEPGTGEINYAAIAKALRDIDFAGTVGLEAWASGDSQTALESFRNAFR